MVKTGLNQPFATASRANILQPSLDCYHGDKHYNIQSLIQMEKIRKDRQHSPVLV